MTLLSTPCTLDEGVASAGSNRGLTLERCFPVALATVSALFFFLASLYSLRLDPAVNSGDFLALYMPRVRLLREAPQDLARWVDPLYPVGYNFLLLGVGKLVGFVLAAKALSVLAATLVFIPVFGIADRLFGRDVAAWSVALLAVNKQMYRFAHWEGPDIIAVLLQLCALWVLLRPPSISRRAAFAAGCCLGAALLLRYQTLLIAVVAAAFFALVLRNRPKDAIVHAGLVLLGAGVVASPQFLANLVTHGGLFPAFPSLGAQQAVSYASGNLGEWWFRNADDFARAMGSEAPTRAQLARHAIRQMFSDLFTLSLVPQPLGSFGWAGMLVAITNRRWRRLPGLQLVVIVALAWIGGVSWYVLHERGMLLLAPILTIFAVFLVWTTVHEAAERRAWKVAAPAVVLGVLLLITAWFTVRPRLWMASYNHTAVEVTAAFQVAGMRATHEVASVTFGPVENSLDADVRYYPLVGWDMARQGVKSWPDLQRFLCARDYRFLLVDQGADEHLFPVMRLLDRAAVPPGIHEIYRRAGPPRVAAFKLVPGELCRE